MSRQCIVYGCLSTSNTYSQYCSTHKSKLRRHGHPEQGGITKSDLKPYLTHYQRILESNSQLNVWGQLDGLWLKLVAQASVSKASTMLNKVRQAADEVTRLAADQVPGVIVKTVVAMFMMAEDQPKRFKDDRAFRTQLVRRVRALSQRNMTASKSARSGRVTRVYTELSPRVTEVMADWLSRIIGPSALLIVRREKEQEAKDREERMRLLQGIGEIKF